MEPIGCPETSARNCHYSLRNNTEERSSHTFRGGSLKSHTSWASLKMEAASYSEKLARMYQCARCHLWITDCAVLLSDSYITLHYITLHYVAVAKYITKRRHH